MTITPPGLRFDNVGDGIGSSRTVNLRARHPFRVTSVEADAALHVEVFPLSGVPGYYILTAEYAGGWSNRPHRGTLTVHTDIPGFACFPIPYEATVQ